MWRQLWGAKTSADRCLSLSRRHVTPLNDNLDDNDDGDGDDDGVNVWNSRT